MGTAAPLPVSRRWVDRFAWPIGLFGAKQLRSRLSDRAENGDEGGQKSRRNPQAVRVAIGPSGTLVPGSPHPR